MTTLSRREFLRFLVPDAAPRQRSQVSAEVHLLNRLSYGATPKSVADVRAMGITAYLDRQLDPDSIADPLMEEWLRRNPIFEMAADELARLRNGEDRINYALIKSMTQRAIYSERQLLERMVEFWADHFNVPIGGAYALNLLPFQRDVIRKHALGNFQTMLVATAKHPAMLEYLDNFTNIAGAPNENYARELMELHTLGVDGGYTEQDVVEVARAFTGWRVDWDTETEFFFDRRDHDTDAKTILGRRLPAGRGIEDGLHVLNMLAYHPQTARYICTKLARRFVSDAPPASLVNALADVWMTTQGEIKPVVRALFLSPEFAASQGQKLRRPLDFFIGSLRASGTEFKQAYVVEEKLAELDQIPYGWLPPNGYPDTAKDWISTQGMLTRWNTAMFVTHEAHSGFEDRVEGVVSHLHARHAKPATVGELVSLVSEYVFGEPLANADQQQFIAYASNNQGADTPLTTQLYAQKLASLYGMMLASPLYQWR